VHFPILGPLQVRANGEWITPGGARHQAILAGLLVDPNWVVSIDQSVEVVWDDEAPDTSRRQIQNCNSARRQWLAGKSLVGCEMTGATIRYFLLDQGDFPDAQRAMDRARKLSHELRYP